MAYPLKSLFIIVLSTISLLAAGQTDRPLRLEFPAPGEEEPYLVIPAGTRGVLLCYPAAGVSSGRESKWVFTLIDINFREAWSREFPLPEVFDHRFTHHAGDTVLLGYLDSEKRGSNRKAAFLFIRLADGHIQSYQEEFPEKTEFLYGRLFHGRLIVGTTDKNDRSSLLFHDLKTDRKKNIVLHETNKTFLKDILPDSAGALIAYELYSGKKEPAMHLALFAADGEKMQDLPLETGPGEQVLNGLKAVRLDSTRVLVLGSYSKETGKNYTESQQRTEESTGFFGGLLQAQGLTEKNFYNFLDFKNFHNRLRGNQAIYEGKRIKKDKEISSDYRIILHDIIRRDHEFLLAGEAYYPEYHTITNWTYDYYGHMVPTYYTVFDGYRYNNAFVCGFDSTGRLLWENSLEINNILTMNLRRRVNLLFDGQEIILAYVTDGKIASKVINKGQTIEGIEYSAIELPEPRDRVQENFDGTLARWYNNFLLAYGYQEVRNSTKAEPRRQVFYMNKIAFR